MNSLLQLLNFIKNRKKITSNKKCLKLDSLLNWLVKNKNGRVFLNHTKRSWKICTKLLERLISTKAQLGFIYWRSRRSWFRNDALPQTILLSSDWSSHCGVPSHFCELSTHPPPVRHLNCCAANNSMECVYDMCAIF